MSDIPESAPLQALATALAKAQGEFQHAAQTSLNPFFKSKYADLASCTDACRSALNKHGLCYVQHVETSGKLVRVQTVLMHATGQSLESRWITLEAKSAGPQEIGSTITYARRYSLCSFLGVVPIGEDDDGNAGNGGKRVTVHDQDDERPIQNSERESKLIEHAKATTPPVGSQAESIATEEIIEWREQSKDGQTWYEFSVESGEHKYVTARAALKDTLCEFQTAMQCVNITYRKTKKGNREIVKVEALPSAEKSEGIKHDMGRSEEMVSERDSREVAAACARRRMD